MPSQLEQVENSYLAALYRKERAATLELALRYRQTVKDLQPLWEKAYRQLQAAKASGATDDYLSGFIWNEQRLSSLMTQAATLFQEMARDTGLTLGNAQRAALNLAKAGAADQMLTGLTPIPTGANVQAGFINFPEAEYQRLVGRLVDGSPITELAREYGKDGPKIIKAELLKGLANGEIPTKVARRMATALGQDYGRLATLARTEMLRVYRDTHQATFEANKRLVKSWRWSAALQDSTCPMCWAMHGTEHPVTEKMATHPCCRCSMTPVMRPWSEIHPGLKGVATIPVPRTGVEEFARLPASRQKAILGPSGYVAYREKMFQLPDLVQTTYSPKWGAGRQQRGLTNVIGPDGMAKVKRLQRNGPAGSGGTSPPPIPGPAPAPRIGPGRGRRSAQPAPAPTNVAVPIPAQVPAVPIAPKGPKGTPVSSFIDQEIPKSGKNIALADAMRDGVEGVDKTHGDGQLSRVPLKLDSSTSHYGVYKSQRLLDPNTSQLKVQPVAIQLSTGVKQTHARLTTAHEIGHYLDQQFLGKALGVSPTNNYGKASNSASSLPVMQAWNTAVKNSRAHQRLRNLQTAASSSTPHIHVKADGTTVQAKLDKGYIQYSLTEHELFARSYAQYVATKQIKAGGPKARLWQEELDETRDPNQSVYHSVQWDDDDFEPIEAAFDALFEKMGGRG